MTISLQFLGAVRHVTGSKHVLTVNDKRILLDCGMVQGPRKMANKANQYLGVEADSIDAVVLSHAHIDHSGSLPRLVKLGYKGTIHCTDATKDLAGVLLADSAHIQAADAEHLAKHGETFVPPYDMDDVLKTYDRMSGKPYHRTFDVCHGVTCTFLDAGHILGAAFVVLDVDDGKTKKRIVFTGDHGRKGLPVLRDPERLPASDVLITESTYGDRLHATPTDMEAELCEIVNEEARDGGRLLIPAFSVGRTQSVLLYLGKLVREGRIPKQPIYIDSPLSNKATKITSMHPELFDDEMRAILESGHDPFHFDGVRFVADVEESKSLNDATNCIIISASGMCEGGRIVHHLKRTIGNPRDCVLLVGFMAEGTLGRKLVEKFDYVKLFGVRHKVRCRVRSISGLSAHADYRELLESYAHLPRNTRVFIVHGEENAALKFSDRLLDAGFEHVEVPVRKEKFEIA